MDSSKAQRRGSGQPVWLAAAHGSNKKSGGFSQKSPRTGVKLVKNFIELSQFGPIL
ncbi:hypothetical protein [Massilia sp. S19_KUP03_FR1]|uniref:hypothetical protein n=1 Tax=Massilia sp. S19_KUP03_FR1 TaxID=3025503 RepID=UPI002FCDA141